MKPEGAIKLVSQLLDLPIVDCEGRWCGVVDDVELAGSAGKEMRIEALLVGPGAYKDRMPAWLFAIMRAILGNEIVRVPVEKIASIRGAVRLNATAARLGLGRGDDRAARWIPHGGAL